MVLPFDQSRKSQQGAEHPYQMSKVPYEQLSLVYAKNSAIVKLLQQVEFARAKNHNQQHLDPLKLRGKSAHSVCSFHVPSSRLSRRNRDFSNLP